MKSQSTESFGLFYLCFTDWFYISVQVCLAYWNCLTSENVQHIENLNFNIWTERTLECLKPFSCHDLQDKSKDSFLRISCSFSYTGLISFYTYILNLVIYSDFDVCSMYMSAEFYWRLHMEIVGNKTGKNFSMYNNARDRWQLEKMKSAMSEKSGMAANFSAGSCKMTGIHQTSVFQVADAELPCLLLLQNSSLLTTSNEL